MRRGRAAAPPKTLCCKLRSTKTSEVFREFDPLLRLPTGQTAVCSHEHEDELPSQSCPTLPVIREGGAAARPQANVANPALPIR